MNQVKVRCRWKRGTRSALGATAHDRWGDGDRLDVGDGGWAPVEAGVGREGRLQARLARLPLQGLDEAWRGVEKGGEKVGEGWRRVEKVGEGRRRVEKGGEGRRRPATCEAATSAREFCNGRRRLLSSAASPSLDTRARSRAVSSACHVRKVSSVCSRLELARAPSRAPPMLGR